MKIFCAQINIISKDISQNFNLMQKNILHALEQKCDLVIFPEMSLPGYFNGDDWEYTQFLKKGDIFHKKLADLSHKISIIFGSIGIDGKHRNEDGLVRKYNAVFCAHRGKFIKNKKTGLSFWPKTLLPNYRQFDDSRHFFDLRKLAYEKKKSVESLYEPLKIKFGKKIYNIGVFICEDSWDKSYSFSPMLLFNKKYKHDFFINISASPYTIEKRTQRKSVFKTLCDKVKKPIVYVNACGTQNLGKNIFTFDGSSCVYNPKSPPLEFDNFCSDHYFIIDATQKKKLIPVTKTDQKSLSKIQEIQILIEYAVKKICTNWSVSKVVIGLSGGIDSALTSVIFARVLGPENVYLVNMPSQFNSQLTQNNAKKLSENIKSPYLVFPIDDLISRKKTQLEHANFEFPNAEKKQELKISSLVMENIQARERGSGLLSTISASLNSVFSCNTNKSELTVGYGTLYGDLGGFLCPIGDLWKTQVYELAHYYNKHIFKSEIIPKEIFEVKPSAELSPNQDVTKGLGDPLIYEYHDRLFASWIEYKHRLTAKDCLTAYQNDFLDKKLGMKPGEIKKLFPDEEKFKQDLYKWWNLYKKMGAIKRIQTPPIIAVSVRCLGNDHRESI